MSESFARQADYDSAYVFFPGKEENISEVTFVQFEQIDAFILLNKGRYDIALEKYLHSATILEKYKSKLPLQYASCLNNVGLAYWTTDNNKLALEYMQEALQIRKQLLGENSLPVAASLNNIGLVYSEEDFNTAEEYYSRALQIYRAILPANHPSIGNSYANMGVVHRKQKKFSEAIAEFEEALLILKQSFGEVHPAIGFLYNNIGQTYLDKGDEVLAKAYYTKGQEVYRKIYGEKNPEVAYAYHVLAELEFKHGNYNAALGHCQNALIANSIAFTNQNIYAQPQSDDYYNAMLMLSSLALKAQILEHRYYYLSLKYKDLNSSYLILLSCDSIIDRSRQFLINHEDKLALGKTSAEIYDQAIRVCLALKSTTPRSNFYANQAFYFSEKNKCAVLIEAIAESNAKSYANIPEALLEQEQTLKADVAWLEQKISSETQQDNQQKWRSELHKKNEEYRSFISNLEREYPQYFDLKYNVATPTVKDICQSLDAETAIVSYFISESSHSIYIFLLSQKGLRIETKTLSADFNKMIVGMRNSIKMQGLNVFYKSATFLYTQLLDFDLPKSIQHLVIVPDGKLGVIPFEALVRPFPAKDSIAFDRLDYVVNHFAISYDYSVLLYIQSLSKSSRCKASESIALLAPVHFAPDEGLSPLPGTIYEVNGIVEIFDRSQIPSVVYTNKTAAESVMKSDSISSYSYIHLATHGVVNETSPELSKIYLSADNSIAEDGSLYSSEIYNLRLEADLITLSACQTGLGTVTKGEGIIGLSRSLLFAGANNLLVSLWTVSDESTPELMQYFYKELLQGKCINSHYAYALQVAKKSMLHSTKYKNPYYWAPFILIGR